MKMIPLALMVCAVAALNSGCSKQEAPVPEMTAASQNTNPPALATPAKATNAAQTNEDPQLVADLAKAAEAQKAVEAKAALDKAAADQAAAAKAAAAEADSKIQSLIDTAKKLIADTKYADALKTLTDLSQLKLTEAQQKVVAALKDQVNKGLADKASTEAGKALGDLLPK